MEIEGQLVKDIGLSGQHVLVSSAPMAASPNVVLFLPSNAAGTSSASRRRCRAAAVTRPDRLGRRRAGARGAQGFAHRRQGGANGRRARGQPEDYLAPRRVLLPSRRRARVERRVGEAAVALSNLLVVSKEKAGTLLCAAELGALPRLISNFDCNEPSKRLPLPRLRILAPIVFHLAPPRHQDTQRRLLLGGALRALLYTAECLALPNLVDASGPTAAPLGADLTRTTFNLLRAYPPNPKTESGQLAINELLDAVASLFSVHEMNSNTTSSAAAAEAPPESLAEAQRAALQIPVALPDDDQNYKRLCKCWVGIFHLLPPLLIAAEATPSEEASNACVLHSSRYRGSSRSTRRHATRSSKKSLAR